MSMSEAWEARREAWEAKRLVWRTESKRRARIAAEPPIASRLPASVDVAAIRRRLGSEFCGVTLGQAEFARRFGFSPAAVADWEQGRRKPEAAARVLLLVIAEHPGLVDDVIRAAIGGEQREELAEAPGEI